MVRLLQRSGTSAGSRGTAALIYRPDGRASDATTGDIWIHGGGYITGMSSMAGMMRMGPILVKNHGCVVVISPE